MRCPKCDEVLINSQRCECGWKAVQTADSGRVCHCGREASVKMNGTWICSEHHAERMSEYKADPVLAKEHIQHIRGLLNKRLTQS